MSLQAVFNVDETISTKRAALAELQRDSERAARELDDIRWRATENTIRRLFAELRELEQLRADGIAGYNRPDATAALPRSRGGEADLAHVWIRKVIDE